jgi:hypothetical protein
MLTSWSIAKPVGPLADFTLWSLHRYLPLPTPTVYEPPGRGICSEGGQVTSSHPPGKILVPVKNQIKIVPQFGTVARDARQLMNYCPDCICYFTRSLFCDISEMADAFKVQFVTSNLDFFLVAHRHYCLVVVYVSVYQLYTTCNYLR